MTICNILKHGKNKIEKEKEYEEKYRIPIDGSEAKTLRVYRLYRDQCAAVDLDQLYVQPGDRSGGKDFILSNDHSFAALFAGGSPSEQFYRNLFCELQVS